MTPNDQSSVAMYRSAFRTRAGVVLLVIGSLGFPVGQTFSSEEGTRVMSSRVDCNDNAIQRSKCIIEAILEDVETNYKHVGGGGISMIEQDATWTYTVSISQEGRKDLITYTVEMSAGGEVTIKDKKTATESRGH